jgi:WD domain, G-beta repeat
MKSKWGVVTTDRCIRDATPSLGLPHYASWLLAVVLTICSPVITPATETVENQTRTDMVVAVEPNEVIAVEPDQDVFDVNDQAVRSIAVSPDGKFLAAGGHDMTLRMWDMETCKLLKAIELRYVGSEAKLRYSDVMSVAFSPDGKHLAAGIRDRTVRIWDLNPLFLLRVKEVRHISGRYSRNCLEPRRKLSRCGWTWTNHSAVAYGGIRA